MNREAIYAALFAKLQSVPGVVTSSRILKHWADVPRQEQPALFMAQGNQICMRTTGLPSKWLLMADIYVYASRSTDQVPGTILNQIIDSVEDSIEPALEGVTVQTLAGVVEYCRIVGSIDTDEGTLGDQSVAIIHVEMLAS